MKYVLAAMLFTSAQPVFAVVTNPFISVSTNSVSQAPGFDTDSNSDFRSTTTVPSSILSFTDSTSGPATGIVVIRATFASASSGSVEYDHFVLADSPGPSFSFTDALFEYGFDLTSNASFRLSSDESFADGVSLFTLSNLTTGLPEFVFNFSPTGPFDQSYVLTPGRYRYSVGSSAEAFDGELEVFSRNSTFEISEITAVIPEPATWAMLIAGFGLVGATLRRRNRSALA